MDFHNQHSLSHCTTHSMPQMGAFSLHRYITVDVGFNFTFFFNNKPVFSANIHIVLSYRRFVKLTLLILIFLDTILCFMKMHADNIRS